MFEVAEVALNQKGRGICAYEGRIGWEGGGLAEPVNKAGPTGTVRWRFGDVCEEEVRKTASRGVWRDGMPTDEKDGRKYKAKLVTKVESSGCR